MQTPYGSLKKNSDKAASWYEKLLNGAWHKGVSKFADIFHAYQWLKHQSLHWGSNHCSSKAGPQHQDNQTLDLPHRGRSQMQVVQATCRHFGTYYQRLQQTRRDLVNLRHNIVASMAYRAIWAECNLEHSKDWWVKWWRQDFMELSHSDWKITASQLAWPRADQLKGGDRLHN